MQALAYRKKEKKFNYSGKKVILWCCENLTVFYTLRKKKIIKVEYELERGQVTKVVGILFLIMYGTATLY